ncbi:hypothetical protein RUND412_006071 [Rhizina undulata]
MHDPPRSSHAPKPSLSSTPSYITKGLLSHTTTVSTPDELPPQSSSSLGGYFSISRSTSTGKKRRPSEAASILRSQKSGENLSRPSLGSRPPTSAGFGEPGMNTGERDRSKIGGIFRSNAREFAAAGAGGLGGGIAIGAVGGGAGIGGVQSPGAMYDTVHDLATKRIATLDYLRRAHEGRVYWFNTLLFTPPDLARTVHTDYRKLTRRANNYFILGNSIPSILEIGTSSPIDYLKAFNHLLQEYESHIALPPARHGGRAHSGSVSGPSQHTTLAARIPKLFSRGREKPRRGSNAVTALSRESSDFGPGERSRSGSGSSTALGGVDDLLPPSSSHSITHPHPHPHSHHVPTSLPTSTPQPETEYLYLTTPQLPFEPDYYETFATLCDVLIDAYTRVLQLIATPGACSGGVGEAFIKADQKVRRVVVQGVVREFEDACRGGIKRELAGVGKEVLVGML